MGRLGWNVAVYDIVMINKIGAMFLNIRNIWPYFATLALTAILLMSGLNRTPAHLNQDELGFSLNAYSIDHSMRDTSGQFLPLYTKHLDYFWAGPVVTYLTAILLIVFPLSESTIRLPSVLTGLSSVALAMVLIHQTFKNKTVTVIVGFLTATTPLLFMLSRVLLESVFPIPFVLLWLVLLKKSLDDKKVSFILLSGLTLGVGTHSYSAAKLYMLLYFLATLFLLIIVFKKPIKPCLYLVVGFMLPVLISLPVFFKNPDIVGHLAGYIKGFDRSVQTEQEIFGIFEPKRLVNIFTKSYLSYFGPNLLFINGDSSLIESTHKSGAFLWPILVLATIGVFVAVKTSDPIAKLILFGLISYPAGPLLVNQPQRISRGSVVIPFMIILAGYGVAYLLHSKNKKVKALLAALLVGTVVQFSFFLYDYHNLYHARSYKWFNGNIGGAMEEGIHQAQRYQSSRLYLDQNIPFVARYAKFYEIKTNTSVQWQIFNPDTAILLTPGSVAVVTASRANTMHNNDVFLEQLATIREPDNTISFYIYLYPRPRRNSSSCLSVLY